MVMGARRWFIGVPYPLRTANRRWNVIGVTAVRRPDGSSGGPFVEVFGHEE
jgi:hypothetical protein